MLVRAACADDGDAIWCILEPVIRAGETYALDRDLTRDEALAYWCDPQHYTFVAEDDGEVIGTYYLRANQRGGGRHVANCGFMTREGYEGRGFGRSMAEHALATAAAKGFKAMQFNFVLETNTGAIGLWERLGFQTVGRLPAAFAHPKAGMVDALVMMRQL